MSRGILTLLLLGVFCAAGFLPGAHATTFLIRPFPDVVESAPIVVRGTAGKSYSNWLDDPQGGRILFTFTELSIEEVLKGLPLGNSILVREMGGKKDGVGLEVPGTAVFKQGESVVVFLGNKNQDTVGSYSVWNMMLGKYHIQQKDGDEWLEGGVFSAHGIRVGESEESHGHGHNDPNQKRWSYTDLKKIIQDQAEKLQENPLKTKISGAALKDSTNNLANSGAAQPLQNTTSEGGGFPTESKAGKGFSHWLMFGSAAVILLVALLIGRATWLRRRRF